MVPNLLRKLSEQFPNISFRILQGSSRNDADIRIFASPYPLAEHSCVQLLEERILLAVPVSNPLSKCSALYAKDLLKENFLTLGNNWALGSLVNHHMEEIHFSPDSILILDNPSLMREFLQEGFHIAFIPEITWRNTAASPPYILRSVEDISMKRYVYLEWNADIELSDTLKSCISAIQDYFDVRQHTFIE